MSSSPGFAVLTDPAALDGIASAWSALWRRVPHASPFQAPQWMRAWWQHYGAPYQLFAVTAWRGSELAAILPLAIRNRTAVLAGSGQTPHLDMLADDAALAVEALHVAMESLLYRCDVIDLQQLPPRSPLTRVAAGQLLQARPNPMALLPPHVAPHLEKRIRYAWRQLGRHGRASMSEEVSEPAFAELCRLRALRRDPVDARARAFHLELIRSSDIPRLSLLLLDEAPIAGYYGFCHGENACCYLEACDPAFEGHGVADVMVSHALDRAHREGATAFHFFDGAEPVLSRWRTHEHVTQRRLIPSA